MKKLAFLTLLAIAVLVSSCGSNRIQPTLTSSAQGNWEAQLTGGSGPATGLTFLINFYFSTQNGNGAGPITINDFSFLNANACFPAGAPDVSGNAQLTNNQNTNQITGTMTITIKSGSGSTLTLNATPPAGQVLGTSNNGAITNGAVNGTWTLTNSTPNSPCNAGGTSSTVQPSFIMCQNATTCTTG
jgi:hypothetical protein